nr:MAG TPA: Prokaryotic membrane lipoprotein lipid attachment site [Caudoviricetes sp.]
MKKMMLICTLFTLVMGCASPRKYKENRSADQFQQADSVSNVGYGRRWLQYHGIIP